MLLNTSEIRSLTQIVAVIPKLRDLSVQQAARF